VVDRSGSYRLNLPFDTSRSETYDIYKNEIDDTYGLVVHRDLDHRHRGPAPSTSSPTSTRHH
jgi:hypothetical protein